MRLAERAWAHPPTLPMMEGRRARRMKTNRWWPVLGKDRSGRQMLRTTTPTEITVGIVTALPVECAALRLLIDGLERLVAAGDRNHYHVVWLPSADAVRPHRTVLTVLPEDGTRNAAAVCADMLRSFPTIRCVVVSGIGGGVPGQGSSGMDIRRGDVVVATKGLVDYDHVRTVDGHDHLRRAVDGMSRDLLRAD